jgi:leader peptidase (prepilin peptidase)/N-methyltransferase
VGRERGRRGGLIRFPGWLPVTFRAVEELLPWLSSPGAVALAGVWGAIWGSFLNVCIARVPRRLSVVRPGSHCFACRAPVRAVDNIPILSYFLLRGRCRSCGARFSVRYPLVELLAALLAAAIFWKFVAADPDGALAVRLARFSLYFAFAATLIVLAFIDLDTKLLPDLITLPAIPVFFLAAFGAHDVPWGERAIGVAAGYLFIRIIADAYYYLLKREGMGLGDGKLLALVGAVLGWKSLPITLFAGSLLGTAISLPVLLAARRRRPNDADSAAPVSDRPQALDSDTTLARAQVPFGPFLAMGALIYLFAGQAIVRLLLGGD